MSGVSSRFRIRALPFLAHFGPHAMSDLSPLSGVERKLDFGAVRSVDDPQRSATVCKDYRHSGNARPSG